MKGEKRNNMNTPPNFLNEPDKAMAKALSLFEAGISKEEIIRQFPSYQKDIEEMVFAVQWLRESAKHIQPSEELLSHTLAVLPPVTKTEASRYIESERREYNTKGRSALVQLIITNWLKSMNKILIPVTAGLAVLVL